MTTMSPDWVIDSPELLIEVLRKDLPKWTAQVTMFNGSWITKGTADTGLVTLELNTFGSKQGLLDIESLVVESLEGIGAEGIMTGDNQRAKYKDARIAWVFYRMARGGEHDQEKESTDL